MDALSNLIEALRGLPGVGPKSAQRMAYQLLQQRARGLKLANCLQEAMTGVVNCAHCNNYSASKICNLCMRSDRDLSLLCIVEGPADVTAIEQTGAYKGAYYVLMGKISPIDGIGPEKLALAGMQTRVAENHTREIIFALSPTLEGRTTAHFIENYLRPYNLHITQLAHGIPSGGSLEFLDGNTIGSALKHRVAY